MNETTIYNDEYIKITSINRDVYIQSFKRGLPSSKLYEILASHPEIEVTDLTSLKAAVNSAPKPSQRLGRIKERIVIELINDELKALVTFNISKEELNTGNNGELTREIADRLREKGIVYGIKENFRTDGLEPGKQYVIAEGDPPINGTDSVITMYKLEDNTPEIRQDGKVNFYELRLINRVKTGDWLGEKTKATEGIPGRSVRDNAIKPSSGKDYTLLYDKNSVQEFQEKDKTVLRSKINGAVNFTDGRISVSNHLEIPGDVDFRTGNIKFDGFVTIKGSIADGFYVEATRDIEVNGELGLGNIKGVFSKYGSIFIKGGFASKGGSEIKAAKNVYTKFVDNGIIMCGEMAHIGFYCINSTINAKQVVLESSSGHIIGGSVKAEYRVSAPIIGTELEKKTIIEISGFDRNLLKQELDNVFHSISELKNEQQKIKGLVASMEGASVDAFKKSQYNENYERLLAIKEQIKEFEEKRKNISDYLKTRGEGEICITNKIYPNCTLVIKNKVLEISEIARGVSFYFQDGEIKHT